MCRFSANCNCQLHLGHFLSDRFVTHSQTVSYLLNSQALPWQKTPSWALLGEVTGGSRLIQNLNTEQFSFESTAFWIKHNPIFSRENKLGILFWDKFKSGVWKGLISVIRMVTDLCLWKKTRFGLSGNSDQTNFEPGKFNTGQISKQILLCLQFVHLSRNSDYPYSDKAGLTCTVIVMNLIFHLFHLGKKTSLN